MSWFMVDVETDGPCPGLYSMIEIGIVRVDEKMDCTFHGKLRPLTGANGAYVFYDEAALKVSGRTHEETLRFPAPASVMDDLFLWVTKNNMQADPRRPGSQQVSHDRPRFISDNNGFDWQFVNYYFWRFCEKNPFGHSSTNLGSLYKGLVKSSKPNFKHLRQTKHSHNPVDDARGNVEALLHMRATMGLEFPL